MSSPPIAFLEGKNPAQGGRAEGPQWELPQSHPIHVPSPIGLTVIAVSPWPCRELPERSLLWHHYYLFSSLILSLQQLLKITTDGQ